MCWQCTSWLLLRARGKLWNKFRLGHLDLWGCGCRLAKDGSRRKEERCDNDTVISEAGHCAERRGDGIEVRYISTSLPLPYPVIEVHRSRSAIPPLGQTRVLRSPKFQFLDVLFSRAISVFLRRYYYYYSDNEPSSVIFHLSFQVR